MDFGINKIGSLSYLLRHVVDLYNIRYIINKCDDNVIDFDILKDGEKINFYYSVNLILRRIKLNKIINVCK